jgi:hypothetical protein
MRNPHFLSHNRGSEYPREVVIVDTETNEVALPDGLTGHTLAFGWAFYARRKHGDEWTYQQWYRFTTPAEFWKWVCGKLRRKSRLTIYCHNAEFDAQVVDAFSILSRRKWKLLQACLEGPPTIIRWRRGSRTIRWLDTLNLWRVPLKQIGDKVGLPKLEMPGKWEGKPEEDIYCKRDVEIVWKALLEWWRFLREHDLGTAAPTLAGQAFNAFRHRFMTVPIFIDSNPEALALARAAYLGGRCECFRLGVIREAGVTLDVNSMYPHIMRSLLAPVKLITVRTRATIADVERYCAAYAVVADVTLDTPEAAYPHVIEGRLCFPVGSFRQCLATPELSYALSRGHIARIHSVAVYERAELFREFVEWGWQTRLKAKAAKDTITDWQTKYMLSSLYGKFGQRGRQWEVVGHDDRDRVAVESSYDLDTRQWKHLRQIHHSIQELQDKGEGINSHPAIAAHVTSAARLYLWQLIQRAGIENVWYVDTDSLKGAAVIQDKLRDHINPEVLGALKLEDTHAEVTIHGCKDYVTPSKIVRKGVRGNAETVNANTFTQLQWFGWAGSLRRGALNMPLTKPITKTLTREYTKGTTTAAGRVLPLVCRL